MTTQELMEQMDEILAKYAVRIAMDVFEEIQQYRALDDKLQIETGITIKELYEKWNVMLAEYLEYQQLGTVEELREIKESAFSGLELANIWAALEKLKKYEAIGTVEELEETKTDLQCYMYEFKKYYELGKYEQVCGAVEKQRAKKPIKINAKWQYRCPCCNNRVTKLCPTEIEVMNSRELFCQSCGQAIDWSEEK